MGYIPPSWLIPMHVCHILGSRLGLLKPRTQCYLKSPQLPPLCALANAEHARNLAAAPREVVHVLCLHAKSPCLQQKQI